MGWPWVYRCRLVGWSCVFVTIGLLVPFVSPGASAAGRASDSVALTAYVEAGTTLLAELATARTYWTAVAPSLPVDERDDAFELIRQVEHDLVDQMRGLTAPPGLDAPHAVWRLMVDEYADAVRLTDRHLEARGTPRTAAREAWAAGDRHADRWHSLVRAVLRP